MHQGLGPRNKIPLAFATTEQCISQGYKTVRSGTKFIIRDTAQMGDHTEKQLACLRQRQGRDTHVERKGAGVPLKEEELSKEAVISSI